MGAFVCDENPLPDHYYTKFRKKAPQKAGTYTYTMSMRGPPPDCNGRFFLYFNVLKVLILAAIYTAYSRRD